MYRLKFNTFCKSPEFFTNPSQIFFFTTIKKDLFSQKNCKKLINLNDNLLIKNPNFPQNLTEIPLKYAKTIPDFFF